MKESIIIFAVILSSITLKAQVASDALRYSYIPQYGGTARAMGVGGSMGAIGGDFSTLSTNPAGLATYRSGEFIFSPSFHGSKTTSLLENGGKDAAAQRFSIRCQHLGRYAGQQFDNYSPRHLGSADLHLHLGRAGFSRRSFHLA